MLNDGLKKLYKALINNEIHSAHMENAIIYTISLYKRNSLSKDLNVVFLPLFVI